MNALASRLKRKLRPTDTEERCGLVLRDGRCFQVENTHGEPARGFRLDASEMVKHEGELAGTWHTHPNQTAALSEEDFMGFRQWPDLTHYIIGTDGVRGYRVVDGFLENAPVD